MLTPPALRVEPSGFLEKLMKQSPLAIAKARFDITETDPTKARVAAKEKLVAAVKKLTDDGLWIDRVNDDKGLEHVSNKKLLRLLDTLTAVKEFGGRSAVIESIAKAESRKDKDYAERFAAWPTPKLWDYHQNKTN